MAEDEPGAFDFHSRCRGIRPAIFMPGIPFRATTQRPFGPSDPTRPGSSARPRAHAARLPVGRSLPAGITAMHTTSATVLAGLIAWTLFLLLLMEGLRIRYLLNGIVTADALRPDNSNLPPFMQRLSRAHANCIETFPIVGGVLILALLTGRADVTDGLAPWLLGFRVLQSGIHLASTNVLAANLRFLAFVVQMAITIYWLWALIGS